MINFLQKLTEPLSNDKDKQRQEFILNILLVAMIVFLIIATSGYIIKLFTISQYSRQNNTISFVVVLLMLFISLILYFLSRRGYARLSSYVLLFNFFFLASYLGYRWGVDLPAEILIFSLIIVMAGVLISAYFAFFVTSAISLIIIIIAYLHRVNIVVPNRRWSSEIWGVGEILLAIIIFSIIAIVSWLSNREIEKSLIRARKSEEELKKERDSLELIVEERTKQLKEKQFEEMSRLHRFAEFGYLSSGIFHDLINPLNAVSLNIEKVKDLGNFSKDIIETKEYLDRAVLATRKMHDLIGAIRKQILLQENSNLFCLNKEIKQVINILSYKAQKAGVQINFNSLGDIEIEGNVVKFDQIILNLIANAIEAYSESDGEDQRDIFVYLAEEKNNIILMVRDFGLGISEENFDKIFEPFFTTKGSGGGIGLGLSMVKRFVEKYFNGTITVESNDKGTSFFVKIPKKKMDSHIFQIKDAQQKEGSFLDFNRDPSVLCTSLMLSCLNKAGAEKEIRDRAAEFLLSQNKGDWKFSDDLAANFFALAALAEYNQELIDGQALAKIMTLLTSIEEKEGGPYYSSDKTVDPIANAAIARFLAVYEVSLPSLEPFVQSLSQIATALNLESLPAFSAALDLESVQSLNEDSAGFFDTLEQRMVDLILEKAQERFAELSPEIKEVALAEIKKTLQGNMDKQMSLMAYYMKQALGSHGEEISDDLVAEMGLANIFFWTAFIIYDDFWDEDEAAQPRFLPTANLYARTYVDFFAREMTELLPEKANFQDFFHKLMDRLDAANTWETLCCRAKVENGIFYIPDKLPDYGDYEHKFEPASGHILGPVAMLAYLGYGLDSPEVKNLISYFRNYLIAMQINDDSHDWEEDLERGHLSPVVVMLLEDLNWDRKEIDLEKDLPELKKVFWFKTIGRAAEIAVIHTEKARQALNAISIFENIAPLERFISTNEKVAKKALKEQKDSVDFLENYKN